MTARAGDARAVKRDHIRRPRTAGSRRTRASGLARPRRPHWTRTSALVARARLLHPPGAAQVDASSDRTSDDLRPSESVALPREAAVAAGRAGAHSEPCPSALSKRRRRTTRRSGPREATASEHHAGLLLPPRGTRGRPRCRTIPFVVRRPCGGRSRWRRLDRADHQRWRDRFATNAIVGSSAWRASPLATRGSRRSTRGHHRIRQRPRSWVGSPTLPLSGRTGHVVDRAGRRFDFCSRPATNRSSSADLVAAAATMRKWALNRAWPWRWPMDALNGRRRGGRPVFGLPPAFEGPRAPPGNFLAFRRLVCCREGRRGAGRVSRAEPFD
jgi:hypothetical protein